MQVSLTRLAVCVPDARLVRRGSTGYGEDGIQSLPGHIGTNDVADCMAALDAAVAEGAGASMRCSRTLTPRDPTPQKTGRKQPVQPGRAVCHKAVSACTAVFATEDLSI